MSIFASETTATIPIPFDAPHTATIHKLTGQDIEIAQTEHMRSLIAGRSARGWAGVFLAKLQAGIATDSDAQLALADPLAGYDRIVVVRAGLSGWSYERKADAAAVADLDDEALEYFAREIMRLTKPALFQTAEEIAEARKNG